MSNSNRSPKGLKDLVDNYKTPCQINDPIQNDENNFINDTIKQLKNLSHEEKTTIGMYKSRIDEQSRLIMVMKQRCDDFINKNISLEKINKELLEQNESYETKYNEIKNKCILIENRFETLAANHQELIKIKDEYKDRCNSLSKENKILHEKLNSNERQDESVIKERDELNKKIELLRNLVNDYEFKCNDLIKKHEFNLNKSKENFDKIEFELKSKIIDLNKTLDDSNKKIVELNAKINEINSNNQKLHRIDLDKIELLTNEKKELIILCDRLKEV